MSALKSLVIRHRSRMLVPIRAVKSLQAALSAQHLVRRYPGVDIVDYPADVLERRRAEGFRSQHGQDIYLDQLLQPSTTPGVFIDIGCNHPLEGSNSAWFEACGWTGHAFDPQSRFADEWASLRRTPFVGGAISRDVAQRDFVDFTVRDGWEHVLSGFADYVSPAHVSAMPHTVRRVPSGPLRHFLPDLGRVDLMLIDVEGAENEVLDGIAFEELLPRWLMIENDKEPGGSEALRGRILAAGYRYVARIGGTDDIFQRRAS
jgi:FkbM family methyltransferase